MATLGPLCGFDQQAKYRQIVDKGTKQDSTYFVESFKGIHQNPELGFMEYHTAKVAGEYLTKYGFEVKTGIAKTGVVSIPKNKGPIAIYRAGWVPMP